MKDTEAKRPKAMEQKNNRLNRLLSDAELDKAELKDLAEGSFGVRNAVAQPLWFCMIDSGFSRDRACRLAGQSHNNQSRPILVAAIEEQMLLRRIRELARRHLSWGRPSLLPLAA